MYCNHGVLTVKISQPNRCNKYCPDLGRKQKPDSLSGKTQNLYVRTSFAIGLSTLNGYSTSAIYALERSCYVERIYAGTMYVAI